MKTNGLIRSPFSVVVSAITATFAIAAPAAWGAAAGAGTSSSIDTLQEVIVTAQKKQENLQTVPVAVTAIETAQLENLQVRSFVNLSGLAPNLAVSQSVSGSDPIFTMRGIISDNVTNGSDASLAMYLDGVYIARTTGSSFDVADLERVEVLRGPQGTLYGKNSTAGAINFITSAPKGEFYGRVEGTVGNLGAQRVKLRIDSPKLGAFSLSGTYVHDEREGWVRNLGAGNTWNFSAANPYFPGSRKSVSRLGDSKSEAGFLAVHFEPADSSITADYKFDRTSATKSNMAQQVILGGTGIIPSAQVSARPLDAVSMPFTTPEELNVFGHSLTVNAEVADGISFKSITGFRGSTDKYSNDVAGSGGAVPGAGAFALTNIIAYERTRQFSQEVQFNSVSKRVDLTTGAYYFHERTTSTAPVYIFQFVPFTLPSRTALAPIIDGDATSNNDSISVYAQATAHATDRLDFTGGLRYTKDSRATDERGSFLGVPRSDFAKDFNKTDWAFNATFRATENLMVYAKASTGYLSGGVYAGQPFNPETVRVYEAGVKTDLLQRRLRINFAAFHTDYNDLQSAGFFVVPGVTPVTTSYYIKNVTSARIQGGELEVTALPFRGLTLNFNFGYTDFKYVGAPSGIAYRPKQNMAVNGNYALPEFGNGIKPSVDINGRYTGNQAFASGAGTQLVPAISQNSAWIVDARFSLANVPLGGSKGKVSLWLKNLTDDRSLVNATNATGGFILNGNFRQPRTYGIDLSLEF